MTNQTHNEKRTYAIVDTKGKVIEYFRIKMIAVNSLREYKKDNFEELKIVKIKWKLIGNTQINYPHLFHKFSFCVLSPL